MVSETFSNNTLDPIAAHGLFIHLARYRHAQTRVTFVVWTNQDLETRIGRNEGVFKNPFKFNAFCKFVLAGECCFTRRLRGAAASNCTGHWLPTQADRRFLPFARRALIIAWPARVDIRARKPCLRARLRRLGWKVRFILLVLQNLFLDSGQLHGPGFPSAGDK
jgi:hypothetical protein